MVDPDERAVRRLGYQDVVKLNSRRGGVRWKLFKFLLERGELGYPMDELAKKWDDFGGDEFPTKSAVWNMVYRLKKDLKPLKVTIEAITDRYVLVEIDPR